MGVGPSMYAVWPPNPNVCIWRTRYGGRSRLAECMYVPDTQLILVSYGDY